MLGGCAAGSCGKAQIELVLPAGAGDTDRIAGGADVWVHPEFVALDLPGRSRLRVPLDKNSEFVDDGAVLPISAPLRDQLQAYRVEMGAPLEVVNVYADSSISWKTIETLLFSMASSGVIDFRFVLSDGKALALTLPWRKREPPGMTLSWSVAARGDTVFLQALPGYTGLKPRRDAELTRMLRRFDVEACPVARNSVRTLAGKTCEAFRNKEMTLRMLVWEDTSVADALELAMEMRANPCKGTLHIGLLASGDKMPTCDLVRPLEVLESFLSRLDKRLQP